MPDAITPRPWNGAKRAGRCATHNDLAWVYDDGSVTCMDRLIVELSTNDCRWEPMPKEWVSGE